jgi:ectoine hydroxylase-related dioxygenase (phytanoyl-CoA dioxygenase family)
MEEGRGVTLTKQQVESFNQNGYLVEDGVLTSNQVEEARVILDEYREQSRLLRSSNDVLDLEVDHRASEPKLRRIKNACTVHPFFGRFMQSPLVLDIVEALLGPNIRYRRSQLNIKTPGGGTAVEWHQDFALEPHSNPDILTVGVAFEDSTRENGCLQVIPGSHRGPVLNHFQGESFVGAIDPARNDADLTSAVCVEVAAGGLWVHHGMILHASGLNRTSSSTRRALLIDYSAVDAWPLYAPVSSLDEYDGKIVRGRASPVIRLVSMAFRLPPLSVSTKTTYDVQAKLSKEAAPLASA